MPLPLLDCRRKDVNIDRYHADAAAADDVRSRYAVAIDAKIRRCKERRCTAAAAEIDVPVYVALAKCAAV